MKRRSMGWDRLPSVSESLTYICTLLAPFGCNHLSPQNLLLAAANHPAATESMWSSLHQLICLQLASPSSSRPVLNLLDSRRGNDTSPDAVAGFVKFYLSLWGYSHSSMLFSLSYQTDESRNLLLALAWLISRCDIFKRALKLKIKKLSPLPSPPTATNVSTTSAAVERARQARARSENYVDKLIAASDKLASVGLRAKARAQQVLMLCGRVRMSTMALHSLLSARAKMMHRLNQIQIDSKIKNQEGYPHTQFDLYLLEHNEALGKHFETLEGMKHICKEMARCEKHEKNFWQWMVAVNLKRGFEGTTERVAPSQGLRVISEFCTVSISPVVKYLKQHSTDLGCKVRFPTESPEPSAEDSVSLKQLSFPDRDNEEVQRLFENIQFRYQGVTFVYETSPTGTSPNSDAESIVERLKSVATALVQALAQTRIRHRICLEDAMKEYLTEAYVLHNF